MTSGVKVRRNGRSTTFAHASPCSSHRSARARQRCRPGSEALSLLELEVELVLPGFADFRGECCLVVVVRRNVVFKERSHDRVPLSRHLLGGEDSDFLLAGLGAEAVLAVLDLAGVRAHVPLSSMKD